MITIGPYFRNPTTKQEKLHDDAHKIAAMDLLAKVNAMLYALGWGFPNDPDTGTPISGQRGGNGDGGFRSPDSTTGAVGSQHKRAHAVDVYDPDDWIDDNLTDEILEKWGLYREHPKHTPGWCHLQDVPPGSGRRTYYI